MNLFATVLTYPAPSANYGGETELNRLVIQKVTGPDNLEYPIFSPESIRNALRETLGKLEPAAPRNRQRLHPVSGKGKSEEGGEGDKQGLAVRFAKYPDPEEFADDFFFGYLLAVKGKELDKLRKEKGEKYPLKRDSVLRMNLARALVPYRHDAVFSQSPEIKDSPWKPGGGESKTSSGLLHRETVDSAFQYPFALNLDDCTKLPPDDKGNRKPHPHGAAWTCQLLQAIGQLNNVAGKHARSYYEFAPASILVRLTKRLVAGYQTYCFKADRSPPNVVLDILAGDTSYPGEEFYLGGEIVRRGLTAEQKQGLETKDVTLDPNPLSLLETVSKAARLKE